MVIGSFYNTAKNYAEKVRQERPAFYTQPEGAICLIIAEDQEIFTGVTGIRIAEGNVVPVPAEANALMAMIAANKPKAKQMVIFSFKDASVIKPCDECLDMLLRADDENSKCEIVLSPDSSDTAINLKAAATSVSAEFLEDKSSDSDAPALGAPAEFVSGFEFDEGNPFLDQESSEPIPEVKTIQSSQPQMPMQDGFAQQQMPMQGAFAQQQMPMQGGFAQQQMPMQGGFAQQQMPMQGGFAQQQMPMQGGFAQQQMPVQGGFAQQQMPMQGGFAQQPNANYARGAEKSVYISDVISTAAAEQYQPSPAASKYAVPGEEGGILKQRLANIFNEDDDDGENNATMSKDELRKQTKDMKKTAKMNAQFLKKQF